MKKFLASIFALIMALTCLPLTASASHQSLMDKYFNGGIQKPKTPYIQHEIPDVHWDDVTIWFDKNDDFNNITTDCLKDPEGFLNEFGLEDCWIIVQADAKVDDGNWLYTTSWDSLDYNNWGNLGLFNNYWHMSPDWYNSKTFHESLMYAHSYNFDEPNENGIFKGTVIKSVNDGYDTYHFDITNHTFSFRYRIGVYCQESSTYEWRGPVFSEWSDVASIGKNGNQQKLTKSANPAAPVLSDFTVNAVGSEKYPNNEYYVFLNVPDSIYQDEKYYVVYEDIFEPINILVQYRVNGGAWKEGSIANGSWLNSGYRLLSLDPVKKGDKIEVRMRFKEGGHDVYTYSAWSNIVTANAAVTDYNYKDEPSQPEKPISDLSGDATEGQVDTFITGLKNDNDAKGTLFWKFPAKQSKVTKNSIKMSWNKVNGAAYYVVYGNKCGSANRYVKIKKVTTLNFTQSGLKKGTYYKYVVSAFDKNGKHIATSRTMHIATKGGKYCNYKSVTTKAKKNKVTLKSKGKTFKLGAKAVKESSKLKANQHRKIRYESSNKKIATVDSTGKITAKKKGTCYVFAYAQNGVYKKIKVTVKK